MKRVFSPFSFFGRNREAGFTLIEVLAALTILSIVSLSLFRNVATSYQVMRRNERNSVAQQLAFEKMEELAAVRPLNLSSANNVTETVSRNYITFTRTAAIVVNADKSRTVTVTVTNKKPALGGSATVTNTFVSWVRE